MAIKSAKELVAAVEKHGSLKAASRQTKTAWTRVHRFYKQALAEGLMEAIRPGAKTKDQIVSHIKNGKTPVKKGKLGGNRKAIKAVPLELREGKVTRFLFTCAQNNTKVHTGFWDNLMLFAKHMKAEVHVSRFAYVRQGLGARGDKTQYFANMNSGGPREEYWFDERITDYISDNRHQVAPGLIWCGEANIIPTAARPLSGLETFTGRASGIFPHVKIAMDSVASAHKDPVKFNYTTGTVTLRNYIARKEGLKAEFHHCYGALLVEVNEVGDWWCRQINADSEGNFYDIDPRGNGCMYVKNGEITTGHRAEAITWGDIHAVHLDPDVKECAWGKGGLLDRLRPKYQFLHDLLDMYARNHHEIDDPHAMFLRHVRRKGDVHEEVAGAADFVAFAHRDFCETVVVNSNHDRALLKWLKNKVALFDSGNVQFWTRLNNRVLNYAASHKTLPTILLEAYLEVTNQAKPPKGVRFLGQDDNFVILPERGGGIECGQHGDDGPNGARGSTATFAKIGRKMNKGHDHTARIIDSVYGAGCSCLLDAEYAHGPSSWSHSHVLTFPNGKRQIITMWKGKAHA